MNFSKHQKQHFRQCIMNLDRLLSAPTQINMYKMMTIEMIVVVRK